MVNFGTQNADHMPLCTCQDWIQWHLPCKHFFAIFNLYPQWGWKQLPNEYLNSAYLSMDTDALRCSFASTLPEDHSITQDVPEEDYSPALDEIPPEKVLKLYTYT